MRTFVFATLLALIAPASVALAASSEHDVYGELCLVGPGVQRSAVESVLFVAGAASCSAMNLAALLVPDAGNGLGAAYCVPSCGASNGTTLVSLTLDNGANVAMPHGVSVASPDRWDPLL